MVHIGVDLHKRTSQIALLTAEGELLQRRLPNDGDSVEQFFAALPPRTPVAIEASGTWWWLVDLLERQGHRAVLSNPKQTKAIAAARLKNDRVDAQRLALLLRGDLLPTVWIPPAELREARELIRHRVSLVWLRGEIRNRLLALLARRNLQPGSGKSWLTARGVRELQGLTLQPIPSLIRADCLALLRALDGQIRRLDAELRARWGSDLRVQRLMTIPGVGPFIAIVLVLELGNIQRFPSGKHLASYIGLTPRVRASADRIRTGHISKRRQSPRALGPRAGGHPGRTATGSAARVVPCHQAAEGHPDRARRARAALGRDRLSHVERRMRLLRRPASRCRAGVSSDVDMVFGPTF
jgi:transposase